MSKRYKMIHESVEEKIPSLYCEVIHQSRELRPIGQYSVSSLDKEFIELLDCLKQERINDIELFLKCSKKLREMTENVIQNLENIIKERYQALDEKLLSISREFEKELVYARIVEQENRTAKEKLSCFSYLHFFCFFLLPLILSILIAFLGFVFSSNL